MCHWAFRIRSLNRLYKIFPNITFSLTMYFENLCLFFVCLFDFTSCLLRCPALTYFFLLASHLKFIKLMFVVYFSIHPWIHDAPYDNSDGVLVKVIAYLFEVYGKLCKIQWVILYCQHVLAIYLFQSCFLLFPPTQNS